MAFRSVALSGFASGAAGDRQQHLQVVVLLGQGAVQVQDLIAGEQLAAQTLERRLDQAVHEGERARLDIVARAEADRHHDERAAISRGIVGHQVEQINRLIADQALYAERAGLTHRLLDRLGHDTADFGRYGHGGGPVQAPARIEYAQRIHTRQQRTQQLRIGLQRGPGGPRSALGYCFAHAWVSFLWRGESPRAVRHALTDFAFRA
jgi:hypothetical protein